MARKKEHARVLGPYPHHGGFRIVVVGAGGQKTRQTYSTEGEAWKVIRHLTRELELHSSKTILEALKEYEMYLVNEKGNKPGPSSESVRRIRAFFPDEH